MELVPPQLETVMVPAPCISYVAVPVPWPLIKEAAGEVLHVYGPFDPGSTETITCPPIQAVIGVEGNTGGAIVGMVKEAEPVQPLTVCMAVNVHDPKPVKFTDAFELFGP